MSTGPGAYAIKAALPGDLARLAPVTHFAEQKTMYGGRDIAVGDTIYVFASENEGGRGLLAMGVVTAAAAVARRPGVLRQTPRVSISVRLTAWATRPLGRAELKSHATWDDGQPQTELNFKLYRQATNKIVGLSDGAAAFLRGQFDGAG